MLRVFRMICVCVLMLVAYCYVSIDNVLCKCNKCNGIFFSPKTQGLNIRDESRSWHCAVQFIYEFMCIIQHTLRPGILHVVRDDIFQLVFAHWHNVQRNHCHQLVLLHLRGYSMAIIYLATVRGFAICVLSHWRRLPECGQTKIFTCTARRSYTVYPKKYAHGFVVLCFVVVMQSFIMNSHEVFIHSHQGCFAGTGAIVRLPQCQWSKPDGYGKISQCITTTKHSKAKTVCIFLWIYCISHAYIKIHIVTNTWEIPRWIP